MAGKLINAGVSNLGKEENITFFRCEDCETLYPELQLYSRTVFPTVKAIMCNEDRVLSCPYCT